MAHIGQPRLSAKHLFATTTAMIAFATLGAPAFAQTAPAPTAEPDDTAPATGDAEIVVTGSRIRGVGPVGSTLIGVSTEDIAKTGLQSTTDVLRTIPQVTSFGADENNQGGNQVQNSSINNTYARTINLRGLGSTATLNLVDGHRIAPGGQAAQLFDVDSIPTIAISRVDIVPDGGSAIYGSDAIAGTVNFILRKPFNGVEARGRYGFADNLDQYTGSIIAGRKWDGGGFMIAYEYNHRSALRASDRAFLYSGDLSAYGGTRTTLSSSPGNITIGGVSYAVPTGQNGSALTLAQLAPGSANYQSPFLGSDVLPLQKRHSVVANFEQELSPDVSFHVEGFYTKRNYSLIQAGAANAAISVPSSNPFSPCNPAANKVNANGIVCPANGVVSVNYSFVNDIGQQRRDGGEQVWWISPGFDIKLGSDWRLSVDGGYSENTESQVQTNGVNSNLLSIAVGNTVAGNVKPANIAFFNPFCGTAATTCNSQATLDYIRGIGNTPYIQSTPAEFDRSTASLTLDGPLFRLPGGPVRLAVGGELMWDRLDSRTISGTTTLPGASVGFVRTVVDRTIKSVYGEVFVPIFSADNAVPFFQRLDVSLAGRFEDYSDFGTTTNPKVGVNWEPVHGLRLHGSFGKSFRAPTLADVNPLATGRIISGTVQGAQIGLPAGAYSVITTNGGNSSLRPEKATTWSLGADWTPSAIRGLNVYLNYYNIEFRDRLDTPAFNVGNVAAINAGGLYDSFIVFNPTFYPTRSTVTQAQFNALYTAKTTNPLLPLAAPPTLATTIAILDGTRANTGTLKTDGIDAGFNWRIGTGFGAVRLGANASYVLSYRTGPIAGAPITENVNTFGYPQEFRGRGELGVDIGGLTATVFANYQNGYTIPRAFIPAASPAQYLNVASYTTFDLNIGYRTPESAGVLAGIGISLSVQNLVDKDPPLVLNNGASPILFDPQFASAVGRLVSLQVSKAF